ncbi:putative aldo/keto reductase [Yersinia pseudotuberculosis]|nr:putative aldo/keto reductase [Yersinia pseudotuberculosis]CQH08116.1 putative aldo/keto reductase [Yersinia pseudotuberculosis]
MDTRSQLASLGPEFSRMICGYWRLMEWGMTPAIVGFYGAAY